MKQLCRAAVARAGLQARLYFTSCGSGNSNLALLGAVQTRTFGKGIVVSASGTPVCSGRWSGWQSFKGYDVPW